MGLVWLSVFLLFTLLVGIGVGFGGVGGILFGDQRRIGCDGIWMRGGGGSRWGCMGRRVQFGGGGFTNEYCS